MSEPTTSDQAETDDWAAAMAEQANAQNEEAPVDDWAAAMAEQEAETKTNRPRNLPPVLY